MCFKHLELLLLKQIGLNFLTSNFFIGVVIVHTPQNKTMAVLRRNESLQTVLLCEYKNSTHKPPT